MKAASIKEIRHDLKHRSSEELMKLCLRLAVFKKENKELLTYLLFESENEEVYINSVKQHIATDFGSINFETNYWAKKSVRRILKETKKFIRYSGKKETEVELLLYFCRKLKNSESLYRNRVLKNIFEREMDLIEKRISKLHEDLQFDYTQELNELLRR